ncbi:MAG: 5-formyltetrahydrofolate cyclo-ligase [Clostridium celatum]|nr:5-formyltetrahydrofolate cyclo-ligase [Clostridium celatum]MDU4977915.1 5-formyltetrahydrofolate cyclo-ligase [Clostridium celatum]
MEKKKVREEIVKKRNNLSSEIKKEYDELIFKQLIESNIYKKAKKIFTYVSFGSEIDTIKFINHALNDNKKIYIPKTDKSKKEMVAIRINSLDNMNVDKWGILEPKVVDKNKIEKNFDLILIPGLAFDRNGNRIGYGGGYYDKYLSQIKETSNKIVLAYDFQIVNNIENEPHDIKTNYIITNNDFIKV